MKIGDRIKMRRKELKMTADDLANKLGKNRATIYRYESSEIENMPIDIIKPLAEALRVSPSYLMGWENEDEKESVIRDSSYNYFPRSISAGLPQVVDGVDQAETINVSDSIMGKWAGDKDIYMMRINGESMNRIIPHGSIIAIKPTECHLLKDGDIVVYSDNHDYSVKRYYRDNDKIIFRPDSHDSRFYDYVTSADNENLVIHGKVVVYIVELD
jgi:transcriptional regulator with XRE-family HTH domain